MGENDARGKGTRTFIRSGESIDSRARWLGVQLPGSEGRLGAVECKALPLLASVTLCWDVGVFLGGHVMCHLQPKACNQLSFWSLCALGGQSHLHHNLPPVKHWH